MTLIWLSFLAFGRALLPGKVLSAADILFVLEPWKSLAPDLHPGNPLLSDATMLFQPWLIWGTSWRVWSFAGHPGCWFKRRKH